ncbi:MAG: MFS transporter [Planctomycetaceae bacterium]
MNGTSTRLTPVQWLICTIAAIGFAFDIYELLMLPLIVSPALADLAGLSPGSPEFQMWVGRLFYIPAFAGGIFGMLGGYLTDRLGRRRVLTWSILLYAVSAFLAGFSTSIEMLLVLRCTTFIGVCVEFVAAIAWLAELFPEPKQRERVLGFTQAFSSIGGLLVAVANGLAVAYAARLPEIALPEWASGWLGGSIADSHAAWRYTLMSGIVPAIPLILIRPFLPESPAWQAKSEAGTLRRPSLRELFAPSLVRTTVVTTILFACSYGAAFGAIQHVQRMVPGLPEVREEIARETNATPNADPRQVAKRVEQRVAARVTTIQEVGGLVGRCLLAVLAIYVVGRRRLLRMFQVPGLMLMPLVFGYAAVTSLPLLSIGIFLAGMVTVAQFSFWGNYLPRVYPLHLRGTGESFAANIGGRMLGTSLAWVTTTLAAQAFLPGDSPATRLAYAAAIVGFAVYAIGTVVSSWLPEPEDGGHAQ